MYNVHPTTHMHIPFPPPPTWPCPDTGAEVAVVEGAMHELHAQVAGRRRDAFDLEERLGADNPPVFAAVQVWCHISPSD